MCNFKTFRAVWMFSVFVMILGTASQRAYSQAVMSTFIAKHAAREGGVEYKAARQTLPGDVNGDKVADLIVLYTLEGFAGGNNYRQYLAVFLRRANGYRYASYDGIGGKLNRNVDLTSVKNQTINLDTKAYRENDPACCPTLNGKTRYRLTRGKLREIK